MKKTLIKIFYLLILLSCNASSAKKEAGSEKDTITIMQSDSLKTARAVADTQTLVSKVIGVYKTGNDSDKYDLGYCDMTITIKERNNKCFYTLKTKSSDHSGEASYKIENNEILITLEGIKWEAGGNVDSTSEPIKFTEITGVLSGKELTFQNDGNSLNYYVKFNECGQKYIQLIKQ